MPALPSFAKPPIVEVVMGAQFRPLANFGIGHVGQFWNTIDADFKSCRENPPLAPQTEDLEHNAGLKDVQVRFSSLPPLPRVFFEHHDQQWLIQLQRDRFLINWRKVESVEYPRYAAVKSQFVSQWSNFKNFVSKRDLGEIQVTQLELTYLNQIPVSRTGASISDVFPDFQWRSSARSLTAPESCTVSCTFLSLETRSRLRVSISPGISQNNEPAFVFELTVRGEPTSDNLPLWFDAARNWIVTAFADLTSDSWHSVWERTE